MSHLIPHEATAPPGTGGKSLGTTEAQASSPAAELAPLLIDIHGLATVLARSVPSLHRDDAAGRLPSAVRIGGSKRWRYADVLSWVEMGCPPRAEFEARRRSVR